MRPRRILAIAVVIAALLPLAVAAQQNKPARIGTLLHGTPANRGHYINWYRQGFKDIGYREGRDYVFISRWSMGKRGRLSALAKELVDARVDVILVNGNTPLRTAAKATKTIPIVVGSASGLGTWGLVASLRRPGGNVTGSTHLDPGLEGKRLQLLKEVVPGARRAGFLFFPGKRGLSELKRSEQAAELLGITIRPLPVRTIGEIEARFGSMQKDRVDGLIMNSNSIVFTYKARVAELVRAQKLPAICVREKMANLACILTYTADWSLMNRRAALFVDRILKGAKAGDLPIERPTKYKLIVNLNIAKAIGITIPRSILLRADRVIQ